MSGVSRPHILTAADVMDHEHGCEGVPGTHRDNRGLVKETGSLACLISTAVEVGLPMSIEGANGKIVGVVTEKSLLSGLSTHEFASSGTADEETLSF